MNAFKRTILVCLIFAPMAWSKSNDPCKGIDDTFCEYDCCYDTMTCRENENETVYLGIDSFLRTKSQSAVDSGTSDNDYAINVAYRFHNVKIDIISKYWKPSLYSYQQWINGPTENPTGCHVDNEGPRKGNVIASLAHFDEIIFVCNDTISIYSLSWSSTSATPWRRIERDSPVCRERFPFLCIEKDRAELIDAFAFKDKDQRIVVAYYGESQISLPHLYERDYKIVVWIDGEEKRNDKNVGQLSAIDIFKIEETFVKGIYATNDGRICEFEHKFGDTNFNFEKPASLMDNCKSLQTYLGCPQAWCLDALIDASFTLTKIADKEQVFFVLHKYMWVLDAKPLPLDVPRVQKAMRLEHENSYSKVKETFVFVVQDSLAAFTYPDESLNETVFCAKEKFWYYFNDSIKDEQGATEYKIDDNRYIDREGLIGNIKLPDATWFDRAKSMLYLFKGDTYLTFVKEGNVRTRRDWNEVGGGNTKDLGLKDADDKAEDGIDAVVSMNGSNYFFTQRERFYEIKDGETKASGPPKLIQKDFFRLLSQCYYNDYDAYEEVLMRKNETLPQKATFEVKQVPFPTETEYYESRENLAIYIMGIILVGVFFAIIMLIMMFMYGNQKRDIIQTRVVTQYVEQGRSLKRAKSSEFLKRRKRKPKSRSRSLSISLKSVSSLKSNSVLKSESPKSSVNSSQPKSTLKPEEPKSSVDSTQSKSGVSTPKSKSGANPLQQKSSASQLQPKSSVGEPKR